MKLRLAASSILVAAFLMAGVPLAAHHGNVAYDTSKAAVLKGTVTKFVWANPHVFIMFDANDDKGNTLHWAGEAGSPSSLGPLGWSSSTLQPGDVITVYIWPSKSGRPVGRLNRVVFPDGKILRDTQLGGGEEKPNN